LPNAFPHLHFTCVLAAIVVSNINPHFGHFTLGTADRKH
jgi:hypothetical protein